MADTSLIFKIIAHDRTQAAMARIKRTAESTGSLVGKALGGPALLPVLAAGGAAVGGLAASLGAAGAAAGVFGGVMKSAMGEVSDAATKVEDLREKIALNNRQAAMAAEHGLDGAAYAKKAAKANLELQARLAELPPATREATRSYLEMKSGWEDFVEANKPATYGTLQRGYNLIGSAIKDFQPLFDIGKAAADRLIGSLQTSVNGGFIDRLAARAGPALESVTTIIINTSRAIAAMTGKLNGEGQGILDWLEKVTVKWASWATDNSADSGMSRFIAYVQQHGPTVVSLLANLGAAAINIVQAVSPLAPVSLAIASGLAAIIGAMPPEMLTALIVGWGLFSAAMKIHAHWAAIMTAVQWAQNAAFLASPITWIIVGIIAIVAVIILIATKTTWFQTIWKHVWDFMKAVGAWFAGPFANFFVETWRKITASLDRAKGQWNTAVNFVKQFFTGMKDAIVRDFNKVVDKANSVVTWFRNMPGKIKGSLSNMFSPLVSGFKSVINTIIRGWNNLNFTIGGGSFAGVDIPSASFGTPNIPYLATGGDIQRTGLAVVHKGERITKAAVARRTGPGTGTQAPPRAIAPRRTEETVGTGEGGTVIRIEGNDSKVVRVLLELLRDGIRDQGGDVIRVLTPR